MRILLLGTTGQVGWELTRTLSVLGKLVTTSRGVNSDLILDVSDLRADLGLSLSARSTACASGARRSRPRRPASSKKASAGRPKSSSASTPSGCASSTKSSTASAAGARGWCDQRV